MDTFYQGQAGLVRASSHFVFFLKASMLFLVEEASNSSSSALFDALSYCVSISLLSQCLPFLSFALNFCLSTRQTTHTMVLLHYEQLSRALFFVSLMVIRSFVRCVFAPRLLLFPLSFFLLGLLNLIILSNPPFLLLSCLQCCA